MELVFFMPKALIQETNHQNPYGPDVDNLAHVVLDALGKTVLKPGGGDGAVIELRVRKRAASNGERSGVLIAVRKCAGL